MAQVLWIDNQFRNLTATGYAEIRVGLRVPVSAEASAVDAQERLRLSIILGEEASEHIVEVQLQLQSRGRADGYRSSRARKPNSAK